jgi:hypothetical protein
LEELFSGITPAVAPRQVVVDMDDLTEDELALLLEEQINLD